MSSMPQRHQPDIVEPALQEMWEKERVFTFDPQTNQRIFSIDTPPPTVSGSMHIGHAFSFAQQDAIARYKKLCGFTIFHPFGTDDNGLATERLIEKTKGIKANKMDREQFISICNDTLDNELRPEYIKDWKRIGMSCDFDIFYSTIDERSRAVSQRAFLELVKSDRVYRKESPVIWDPIMQTALSQVELVDQQVSSTFNDIIFKDEQGAVITVATTRPELLSACVAVFVHPDDTRYTHLVGKSLTVPFYHFSVPLLTDHRADPAKGTGVVMCCTFGDQTDIEWYKAHKLPLKQAIARDGTMTSVAGPLEGMTVQQARKTIIEHMKQSGELVKQETITHVINVGERSGAPIEFIHSPQWYIKYLDLKEQFIEQGRKLTWKPQHMRHRYENWVNGLQWDWCISRQRYFGVPFPVWYHKKTGEPIFADESQLPVDPLVDVPQGYTRDELEPEKDVMDTWATSSLTPLLATEQFKDHPVYSKLLPMSLRPQAHDIISFWLFNTVVRSWLSTKQLPWETVMISGWALDPQGKKMSKSKGNTVAPQSLIQKYSADALRYWANCSRFGDDVAFQEKDLVTGTKLINKIWNAARFASAHLESYDGLHPEKKDAIDQWIMGRCDQVIKQAAEYYDAYEVYKAKALIERFFMDELCDNYLEIIKQRLYDTQDPTRNSAVYTLYTTLRSTLLMLAPIMPFITEQVYQYVLRKSADPASIHQLTWPSPIGGWSESHISGGQAVLKIIAAVRQAKNAKQISLREPFTELQIAATSAIKEFIPAISSVTKAQHVTLTDQLNSDAQQLESNLAIRIIWDQSE